MASKSAPKKTSSTSPRRSIRRQFLRSSASALAVLYVISSSSLGLAGTVAPSERITLGLIGCGIHGAGAGQDEAKHGPGWSLNQIFRNDDTQLVAVCDVDQSRVEMAKRKVDNITPRRSARLTPCYLAYSGSPGPTMVSVFLYSSQMHV